MTDATNAPVADAAAAAAAPPADPAVPAAAPLAAPAAPPAAVAAPAEIELTAPADAGIPPEYIKGLRGIATEHKISAPQAQAFLNYTLAQRAAAAKAASAEAAATKASWDAALAKDFPGPALAAAHDSIAAFIKTRAPELAPYLLEQGVVRYPPAFKLFASIAAAAAESGKMPTGIAPAQAATNPQNDLSAMFTHPTSRAAMAQASAAGG